MEHFHSPQGSQASSFVGSHPFFELLFSLRETGKLLTGAPDDLDKKARCTKRANASQTSAVQHSRICVEAYFDVVCRNFLQLQEEWPQGFRLR